jgi:hypothetical protein
MTTPNGDARSASNLTKTSLRYAKLAMSTDLAANPKSKKFHSDFNAYPESALSSAQKVVSVSLYIVVLCALIDWSLYDMTRSESV